MDGGRMVASRPGRAGAHSRLAGRPRRSRRRRRQRPARHCGERRGSSVLPCFKELFVTQDFPLSGWRWGMTTYYFPEYLIQWTLFALGADLHVGFAFHSAGATLVFSAGGWILVCHRLFGPSPARATAVVLLAHAAPLLIIGWGRARCFWNPADHPCIALALGRSCRGCSG